MTEVAKRPNIALRRKASSPAQRSTSSSLLHRVNAEDQDGWRQLVDLYSPLIYHWCRREGLQRADAENIGQEVFLAMRRQLANFKRRGSGSFRGWLKSITRTKILDHWRRGRREPPGQGGSGPLSWIWKQPAGEDLDSDDPDDLPEISRLMRRALDLVRPEFKKRTLEAVLLVVVEGHDPADVARKLGMTVGAVYTAK